MIEITLNTRDIDKIPIDEADIRHGFYYGVRRGDDRGFVVRQEWDRGDYIVFCADSFTAGNYWSQCRSHNLRECIRSAAADSGFHVYQFHTPEDLFLWLSCRTVSTSQPE
jgi:hypothetical protein